MNKTYDQIKEEFKKTILKMEQDLISESSVIDSQQVVNRIVKEFDQIKEELKEAGNL